MKKQHFHLILFLVCTIAFTSVILTCEETSSTTSATTTTTYTVTFNASRTLDGNNKTIRNLFINARHVNWTSSGTFIPNTTLDEDFIGLFGQINRTESDPAVFPEL